VAAGNQRGPPQAASHPAKRLCGGLDTVISLWRLNYQQRGADPELGDAMPILPIIANLGGKVAWSAATAWARQILGREIRITSPRPNELLHEDPKPLATGSGSSYVVRGTLKYLPKGHHIWLVTESERSGHV
jgi:hypothetical protein